jgi:hypothetical protein
MGNRHRLFQGQVMRVIVVVIAVIVVVMNAKTINATVRGSLQPRQLPI